MNQASLDDLIIGGGNASDAPKKPRGKIVIIALIIVILFVGVMLIKSIMGTSTNNDIDLNMTKATTADKVEDAVVDKTTDKDKKDEPSKDNLESALENINDDISLENSDAPTISTPPANDKVKIDENQTTETIGTEKQVSKKTGRKTEEASTQKEPKVEAPIISAPKVKITQEKPAQTMQATRNTSPRIDTAKASEPKTEPTPMQEKKRPPATIKTQEIYQGGAVTSTSKNIKKSTNRPHRTSRSSTVTSSAPSGYYIQVGSYNRKPSQSYIDEISSNGFDCVVVNINGSYRLRIGPFQSYDSAQQRLTDVHTKVAPDAFIVNP